MKFYKFKAEGKLWAQRVTSEPTTTEGDIGRLFFGTSNNYLSIRNNTGWSQLWDADNIDALSAAIAADATSTANLVAALDPSFIRKDEADSTPFTVGFGGLTLAGDIDMNSSYQIVNLQAPDTAGQAIRQTTNVTEANLNTLTGGGDTTLHDHDGISENTAARHTQGTDTTLGTMAGDIDMNNSYQIVNLQAPDASGQAIRQTTNVTEANLNTLTGGGDTTLHDHAGISENTAARHTQGTDTTLGTMAANINMNGFNVLGANSFTINDDGDNEGFMGPGNAWGFHHPTAAQGGYDAVEITIDDSFQIRNGSTLRLQLTTAGSLSLTSGTGVTEFSIDGTLGGNSDNALPTEKAVKTYADTKLGLTAKAADSDLWDGANFADYLDQSVKQAASPNWASWFKVSNPYYYYNVIENQGGASETGTLKITLPFSWTSTMIKVIVQGYEYTNQRSAWEFAIGFYNQLATPDYFSTHVQVHGYPPSSAVRLSHDGSKCCILIGTTGTVWQYPKVAVTEVMTGHSNRENYESGWAMAWIASEAGITDYDTPIVGHYFGGQYYAGTGFLTANNKVADSSLLGGKASTSASTVSTVVERDSAGDINVRLLRSEYDATSGTINYIMTQIDTASNNYVRPSTPSQFRAAVTASYYLGISATAASAKYA